MMLVAVVGTHLGFLAVHAPAVQGLLVDLALAPGSGSRSRSTPSTCSASPCSWCRAGVTADWLRRRYQAKRISDQMMTFDAIWLLMTLIACSRLATEQGAFGWLGLLAFAAYRLVVSFGMRPLARGPARSRTPACSCFGCSVRSGGASACSTCSARAGAIAAASS